MKRKLLFLLACIMAVSMQWASADVVVIEGLKGGGTEADPYLIENLDDLMVFKEKAMGTYQRFRDTYYELTADIHLPEGKWEPIGKEGHASAFSGHFDGGEHTISNLHIYDETLPEGGFFGVTNGGFIKNLTIRPVNSDSRTVENYGSLIGVASNGTEVSNCHILPSIDSKVRIRADKKLGGLIGSAKNGVKITNCSVDLFLAVADVEYVGGLVGYSEGDITIENCKVTIAEQITAKEDYIGGLVGRVAGVATIINSHVSGEGYLRGKGYQGGLLGSVTKANISGCSFTAEYILGYGHIGGLVGSMADGSIEKSFSTVDINLMKAYEPNQAIHIGGLVGSMGRTSLTDCYAIGDIQAPVTGGLIALLSMGGLVGYMGPNSNITHCYATGKTFYDPSRFGGLVGLRYSDTEIVDSYYNFDSDRSHKGVNGGSKVGVQSKLLPELLMKSTFEGWDFDDVWTIDDGRTAPYFPGQSEESKPAFSPVFDLGEGIGTDDDPWQINSAEKLNSLRYFLGEGNNDKYFVLTEDIYLDAYLATDKTGKGWEPIGTDNAETPTLVAFCASLDGNGHTIHGLWSNRPEEDHVALFGVTSGATLEKLYVMVDKKGITGGDYVAGLVGKASKTNFTQCFVGGRPISGSGEIGGLAAYLSDSKVKESSAHVDIRLLENGDGNLYAGGLAGHCLSGTTLTDVYSTSDITLANPEGNYSGLSAGGLVGVTNSATITRGYGIGEVVQNGNSGGLVGLNQAATFVNTYFNKDDNAKGVGSGTSDGVAGNEMGEMLKVANFTGWTIDGSLWKLRDGLSSPYFVWQEDFFIPFYSPYFSGGDGSDEHPWEITDAEELENLDNFTGEEHEDKNFVITDDVDLTDYLEGEGNNGGQGWKPIGDEDNPFYGSVEGGDNTIEGLWSNRDEDDNVGLFGVTKGSKIENVHVILAEKGMTGKDKVAGLVGNALDNTIVTKCSVTGEGAVSAYRTAGGLIGYADASVDKSFSSVNLMVLEQLKDDDGIVQASVGGLIGELASGTLVDSYAFGNISPVNPTEGYGKQHLSLGGLVGHYATSATLRACYAGGKVAPKHEFGIQGEKSWFFGGLLGHNAENSGSASDTYFNANANTNGVGSGSLTGINGKLIADLMRQRTFEGWNFSDELWTIREGETMPYFSWQGEETLPFFTVPPAGESYTISLIVGGDIYCNYETGELEVAKDDHLYLQFYTEDRAMTTDDILFKVDGVETPLQARAGSNYSYILNPVTQDTEIVIALKEYTITIPEIEGVISDPAAGEHRVASDLPFTFTLTPEGETSLDSARVLINGEELPQNLLKTTSLSYTIEKVLDHLTIEVQGISPTSNITLGETGVNISVIHSQLSIMNETGKPIDVLVYAVTGKQVASLQGLLGTRTITLPRGIYVVRVGTQTTKISIF